MRRSEWTCLAACAALSTALGCNAVWGISEGEVHGDPSTGGAGGAGGAGGSGAAGGPASACPSEPFTGRAPGACHDADGVHDYLSDPENCCVPGRSCLGGACEEGRCQPVVLTTITDDHEAIGIAVEGEGDDARVLWGSGYGSTVFATEKAALGATEPLVVLDSLVTMLASADGSLFITDWSAPDVYRMPLEGNTTVPTVATAEGEARYRAPVVGNGWVYWITGIPQEPDQEADAPEAPQRIWAARVDQTDQTGLPVLDRDTYVGGLAQDGTHLYWTELEPGSAQSTVRRMALGEPSDPEIIASTRVEADELPGNIAVGERIFWIVGSNIHAANKDGSGAGVLASADYPTRFLADADFVYWYSSGDNQMQRVRTSGGAPEPLAESAYVRGLAQDCRALYWTTWSTEEAPASVIKLAK
ncbi:hypothetical protein WMF04_31860 [Sorangium sp. So ce260]|uniref:hypothetical protein n=1 Tax=Sorangium sp. So ce260 TaxID=3133291 RepID=UPI003F5EDC44